MNANYFAAGSKPAPGASPTTLTITFLALAFAGCAGWREGWPRAIRQPNWREQRATEAVREFEDHRDAAQFAAAVEAACSKAIPSGPKRCWFPS